MSCPVLWKKSQAGRGFRVALSAFNRFFWVPRPRLCVGVPWKVKWIRLKTNGQQRGRSAAPLAARRSPRPSAHLLRRLLGIELVGVDSPVPKPILGLVVVRSVQKLVITPDA